jgi:hypothetical protein
MRCVYAHVSGATLLQVEQEEEFLTNTLQKKLEKVTRHGNCQQLAQRAAIACFLLCCVVVPFALQAVLEPSAWQSVGSTLISVASAA